jgi:RHS repeat-associated protein
MTFEPVEGGRYFIHVDQDTLSVYVRLLSNDVIGTDDEEQHIFYQYPKHNWLVGVGTVGGGIDPNPSSIEDGHMTLNSAPADESLDETPATSYGYALDGRRIGKAGAVEVKYLYNGQNVIYELLANRTIRYTTAFIDRPICRVDGSLKYYYLFDGLGSVSELINEAEEVVNVYRYSPFGDSLIKIEGIANPYQFNAREFDAESGLYHYRSRAYSSGLGGSCSRIPRGWRTGRICTLIQSTIL